MKRQPCNYCAARGGKRHADDCSRPRRVTEAVASGNRGTRFKNRIAILIDYSSSMSGLRNDVPRVLNDQIRSIKENAAKLDQDTSVTLYRFADRVTKDGHYEDAFDCPKVIGYDPWGQTALMDAVGQAIKDFEDGPSDKDTSFLIIVITDGQENASRAYTQDSLMRLMRRVEATDRWTFVFSVPRGYAGWISKLGVPSGNIQEWDITRQGLETMAVNNSAGIGSFYATRSMGMTKSSNFYQPDMAKVSKSAIRNLNDRSQDFQVWNVNDTLPIREFVERQLSNQPGLAKRVGRGYQLGRGYYQLTKSEEVQASKDIVILDKSTNALYGGTEARALIGCPTNIAFKIKPGNHMNYDIFIKSTSVNRKLLPGTKLLYYVS